MKRLLVLCLFLASIASAQVVTFTIANGASLSDTKDMRLCTAMRIVMPSAWTAANLTFQVLSEDGGTLTNLYDEFGAVVTITADASRTIRLSPGDWWNLRFMVIRSGTPDTPVNQGGARTIKVICR